MRSAMKAVSPGSIEAIELVRPRAAEITLRGDTDFTLSGELDRWDSQGLSHFWHGCSSYCPTG